MPPELEPPPIIRILKDLEKDFGALSYRWMKNEYWELGESWIGFDYRGATFKIGPRKRVQSIDVTFPQDVPTHRVRELATRDHVTYVPKSAPVVRRLEEMGDWDAQTPHIQDYLREANPNGTFIDTHLPKETPVARRIIIHAWDMEAVLEYTRTLLQIAAQGTSPR